LAQRQADSRGRLTYSGVYALMKRGNFWMDRVTQPIATVAVLLFARLGVSPNAVTVTKAVVLIAAAGVVFMEQAAPWTGVVFAVASQLSYALDGADGALARVTGRSSQFGGWFDLLLDRITHVSVLALLGLALLGDGFSRSDAIGAIAPVLLLMVVSVAYHNGFNLRGALFPSTGSQESPAVPFSVARAGQAVLLTTCDFGFFMFILSIGLMGGSLIAAVWVTAALHSIGLAALVVRVNQLSKECD